MIENDPKRRLLALHAAKEVCEAKHSFRTNIHGSLGSHTLFARSIRGCCRFAMGTSVRKLAERRGDDKKCCCCLPRKASDHCSIEILTTTPCKDPRCLKMYITDILSLGPHPRSKRRYSGHCRLCYPLYIHRCFEIIWRTSLSSPCWLLVTHGRWESCRFSSSK